MDNIEFSLTQRQLDFTSIPDSVFEALYGGAAGGGKTEILLMLPIIREFYKHPKFKGLMLRRTFPELEREVIRRSQHWFPLTGAKYDSEKKSWKWPWGSYFDFGHVEHESDIKKYDTAEYNYVAWDELTSFTEYQYLYITVSRCRSSSPELPAFSRAGTNPDGLGHLWTKKRFVSINPAGYTILKDKLSNSKRIFIPARATDNPHLIKNDPEYINRLKLLPERERRAKLEGSWDINLGQAFSEFRRIKMSDEPENAFHLVKPFDIPSWWVKIGAMDWGWSANNITLKAAISPEGRVYITNRLQHNKEYIANIGIDVRNLCSDCKFFSLDPSAWSKDPGKKFSIATQFHIASGINPIKANNDRIAGKALIHEFLRFIPKNSIIKPKPSSEFDLELSQKILRIGGQIAYDKYIQSFQPIEVENNLPKLQIFDTKELEPFIDMFSACVSDEKNPEDIAEFEGDDDYDALRYLLFLVNYTKSKENNLESKREELISKFNSGEIEINNFYRQMEYLEIKGTNDKINTNRHYNPQRSKV